MMEQDRLLGRADTRRPGQGAVPEQRGPADLPPYQDGAHPEAGYRATGPETGWPQPPRQEGPRSEAARTEGPAAGGLPDAGQDGGLPDGATGPGPRRSGARLRVDARRNLESVLRAAREVFGEFGYDAPMEEVARRAGVGVGTVYRRFPSKEVLVQRIASEEVAWLTTQARESLYSGGGPWESLADYLARAVGTGAGRLLPPEAFRYAEELGRVPGQRGAHTSGTGPWPGRAADPAPGASGSAAGAPDADPRLLLQLLAALVARAGAAGELRPGVTVSDVVLVLTASVPVHAAQAAHPAAGQGVEDRGTGGWGTEGQLGSGPGARLLEILLDGLRAR
ncbi:TetR/AcrR family transcriptional regulator [Kitasatospora sp. NPDC057015]|uniref:TetR/AcrR family transcriptional regulator n=1 Tax=Kitasatospora sp. NPDC057015 TaxID=3346001 RepID=UPI00363183BE